GFANGSLRVQGDGRAAGEDGFAADDRTHAAGAAAGAGGVRARSRNRRALFCEVASVSVEQVSRRGHSAWSGDEIDRRSDGRGRQLRRGLREGAAFRWAKASVEGHG